MYDSRSDSIIFKRKANQSFNRSFLNDKISSLFIDKNHQKIRNLVLNV